MSVSFRSISRLVIDFESREGVPTTLEFNDLRDCQLELVELFGMPESNAWAYLSLSGAATSPYRSIDTEADEVTPEAPVEDAPSVTTFIGAHPPLYVERPGKPPLVWAWVAAGLLLTPLVAVLWVWAGATIARLL